MAAIERRKKMVVSSGGSPRHLHAVLWPGLDHGDFLASVERRKEVIERVLA